ncbi:hypothetical protein D3C72_2186540 [compost metagenome]
MAACWVRARTRRSPFGSSKKTMQASWGTARLISLPMSSRLSPRSIRELMRWAIWLRMASSWWATSRARRDCRTLR